MSKSLGIAPAFPTKEELLALYNHEKDARLARRYLAMYLLASGSKICEVARVIGRNPKTVSRWAKAFRKRGIAGLWWKKKPGRASRLTREQLKELEADLQRNPRDLGYEFSNWDGKRFMYHIEKKFGVKFKVRRVQVLMRTLGFTLQRPRRRSEKTNKPAEDAWTAKMEGKKNSSLDLTTSSCTWTRPASSGS
jgi:transposase